MKPTAFLVPWENKNSNKHLARLIRKREKTQITNIRNERGSISTDSTDIKKITREFWTLCQYFLQLRGNEQIHWKIQTTKTYLIINRYPDSPMPKKEIKILV